MRKGLLKIIMSITLSIAVAVSCFSMSSVSAASLPDKSLIQYSTHVQDLGWQNYVGNGETSGTSGKSLRL